MVSSTGHDGPMGASGVKRLSKLGMITGAPGMGALDMNSAEDAVVRLAVICTPRLPQCIFAAAAHPAISAVPQSLMHPFSSRLKPSPSQRSKAAFIRAGGAHP